MGSLKQNTSFGADPLAMSVIDEILEELDGQGVKASRGLLIRTALYAYLYSIAPKKMDAARSMSAYNSGSEEDTVKQIKAMNNDILRAERLTKNIQQIVSKDNSGNND